MPMLPQRTAGRPGWDFHAAGPGGSPMPPRDTWRRFVGWLHRAALPRFCSSRLRFSATNCSFNITYYYGGKMICKEGKRQANQRTSFDTYTKQTDIHSHSLCLTMHEEHRLAGYEMW